MNVEVYTDGSSKGNPGPAGAGAVIYKDDVEIWGDCMYVGDKETNNVAEYQGVIIPVTSAHSHMLSRNLLYTAITRGKRHVCIVGERRTFAIAIKQFAKDFRYTHLCERLQNTI